MKKIISMCLTLLTILSVMSVNTFAKEIVIDDLSFILKEELIIDEAYGLYNTSDDSDVNLMSTGLITGKYLQLAKTTDKLLINAKTTCSTDVKKCGFTYIKLQRLISGSWTDYTTYCYYDQYSESTTKTFSKSLSVPRGYTYRVICEHYAEKSKLLVFTDKETAYNVTSSIAF